MEIEERFLDSVPAETAGSSLGMTDGVQRRSWAEVKKGDGVSTRPVLANAGAMSQFIGAFEVTSKLSGETYQCRFSHMWNGIATRHADTIDAKFFVDGAAHVVGMAHTAFVQFREKAGRDLTDREASFLAAEYLRERLEEDDLRPLYDAAHDDVLRLIGQTGIQ